MVKVTDMERHVTNCAAPEGGIELMAAIAGMMWRNYKVKSHGLSHGSAPSPPCRRWQNGWPSGGGKI